MPARGRGPAPRRLATVLVKCGSHRARRKLLLLVGEDNAQAMFSLHRETGHGGAYRIPADLEREAKAITGVSGLRDGEDLQPCISWRAWVGEAHA